MGSLSVDDQPTIHGYREPCDVLKAMATAPKPPALAMSPCKRFAVLCEIPALPSIIEVATEDVKLAGIRHGF
jgi:hypothetical protein